MWKIATATRQDSLLARAYCSFVNYFSNTGYYKQSIEYLLKSMALAEKATGI